MAKEKRRAALDETRPAEELEAELGWVRVWALQLSSGLTGAWPAPPDAHASVVGP